MHGGAPGSGAPLGNRNAFKHGLYSREATDLRRRIQDVVRRARELARAIG
jgi:hypothetical protein